MARPDRREVHEAAVAGMLRREDVVVERALVVVDVRRVGCLAKQLLGQPEHVVGVAGLRPLARLEHRGEVVGGIEVLPHAVASECDGPATDHGLPEEHRRREARGIPAELGDACVADDLGICVLACSPVSGSSRRPSGSSNARWENRSARVEVLPIAGDGEHVGQHLVHPAVFGGTFPATGYPTTSRRAFRTSPRGRSGTCRASLAARNEEGVA